MNNRNQCSDFEECVRVAQQTWSFYKLLRLIIPVLAFGSYILRALSVCFAVVCIPLQAYSMTVSDPTSYTYYVEQIKKSQEQVEHAMSQINELQNVVNMTADVRDQLVNAYDQAKGVLQEFERAKKDLSSRPMSLADYISDYLPADQKLDEYKDEYGKILPEKVLDEVFKDPRSKGFNMQEEYSKIRAARQDALKKAIVEAENYHQSLDSRLNTIDGFLKRIDDAEKNENLKASQDLTASILTEVLIAIREIQSLLARYISASSMLQYTGHNSEISKAKMRADNKPNKTLVKFKKELESSRFKSAWDEL